MAKRRKKVRNPSDGLPLNAPPFVVYAFVSSDPDNEEEYYNWNSLWFSSLERLTMARFSEFNADVEPGEKLRSVWFDDPTTAFNFADKIADQDRVIVVVKLSGGLNAVTLWILPWATSWSKERKTQMSDGIEFDGLYEAIELYCGDDRDKIYFSFPGSHWRKYDWCDTSWYK